MSPNLPPITSSTYLILTKSRVCQMSQGNFLEGTYYRMLQQQNEII